MRHRTTAGFFAFATLTGCAVTPAPAQIPTFAVEAEASELKLRSFEVVSAPDVEDLRNDLAERLSAMTANRADKAKPARFKAVATVESNNALSLACLSLVFLGCPSSIRSAKVILSLDVDGQTFAGQGSASAVNFLYTNRSFAAVKAATERALLDAATKARAAGVAINKL